MEKENTPDWCKGYEVATAQWKKRYDELKKENEQLKERLRVAEQVPVPSVDWETKIADMADEIFALEPDAPDWKIPTKQTLATIEGCKDNWIEGAKWMLKQQAPVPSVDVKP